MDEQRINYGNFRELQHRRLTAGQQVGSFYLFPLFENEFFPGNKAFIIFQIILIEKKGEENKRFIMEVIHNCTTYRCIQYFYIKAFFVY